MLLFPLFVRVARLFPPWLAHHLGTSLWRIVRARTRAPLPAAYICKLQICEFAPQQNLSFCLRQVIWWLPSNSRGGGESDGFHTHKKKKGSAASFRGLWVTQQFSTPRALSMSSYPVRHHSKYPHLWTGWEGGVCVKRAFSLNRSHTCQWYTENFYSISNCVSVVCWEEELPRLKCRTLPSHLVFCIPPPKKSCMVGLILLHWLQFGLPTSVEIHKYTNSKLSTGQI